MHPFSHNNEAADYSIDPSLNRWINEPINQLTNLPIVDQASIQTNKPNEQ